VAAGRTIRRYGEELKEVARAPSRRLVLIEKDS
jgi:hypothetical protein